MTDRELLGRIVHSVRVKEARTWTTPWGALPEQEREVDRKIGEAVELVVRNAVVEELLHHADRWLPPSPDPLRKVARWTLRDAAFLVADPRLGNLLAGIRDVEIATVGDETLH